MIVTAWLRVAHTGSPARRSTPQEAANPLNYGVFLATLPSQVDRKGTRNAPHSGFFYVHVWDPKHCVDRSTEKAWRNAPYMRREGMFWKFFQLRQLIQSAKKPITVT
ncbi:hypothetical protein ANCCAN_19351 [Ancylostoma caninum]|uniref:Uncharacterized protein n=1 Tax=Ancylostoma caninum TaxID=29170 RepID=A0A368FVH3_ANCCA|nr:hypothetical protein ANCCAN_19351 [Ancylostoma caninum]